jgi:hypothetical protein
MFRERRIKMKRRYLSSLIALGFAAFLFAPDPALAQTPPPLGVLQQFSVMAQSGVVGSAGAGSVVNGDVGSFPTDTVTNFPPSSVGPGFFVRHVALGDTGLLTQARTDSIAAFVALNQGPGTVLLADLSGQIVTPGVYTFVTGAALLPAGGVLTLNDPTGTGVFVFRTGSTLTTINTSNVVGSANPCNVYWQIGSSATIDSATFFGNVIANASITVTGNLRGRAIAGTGPTGAVTMAVGGNTIGGCAIAGPGPSPSPVPTLPQIGAWALILALLAGGAYLVGRRTPTEASR